ncbi:hypothetical protein BDM02DRAFT_1345644 [Thelephora ganbajun]|uniref:Uncharacterized protein n=1 Tax=Thelephora ganbajun TaxID=370292 RepID=A0ACB6ZN65_THEGA|nr:hypothetical protein BDM02DRAFT_1345644 [Thelephora ganbajun]
MDRGCGPLSKKRKSSCCHQSVNFYDERKLGVAEEDMKPTFLMISACHGDQAKSAKDSSGLNTMESTRHYQLSLKWLQKVYGTSVPLQKQGPINTSDLAGPISLVENSPLSDVDSSRNGDEQLAPPSRPTFLPAPRNSPPTSPQSPSANRIRVLEHQVDILRERDAHSEKTAAESEALKRKYEQELSHEKSKRRKVQTELDEISAELKTTRRMEKYASDLVKKEVELRRKAEMREKELTKRIEVLEEEKKRVSNGGKAVLFEDLANMFQKAAQAQGDGSGDSLKLGGDSSFGGSTLVSSSDRDAASLARF